MESLRAAFIKNLKTVPWMDEETRALALEKSYNMRPKFGYPDQLYDEKWLLNLWKGVQRTAKLHYF